MAEGVVVNGERDESGVIDFDEKFVVFSATDNAVGELIRCNGANCHYRLMSIVWPLWTGLFVALCSETQRGQF